MILVHIVNIADFTNFLRGQLSYIKKNCGFEEIYVTCSPDSRIKEISLREDVQIHPIEIERSITPLKDLRAIYKIYRFLHSLKPTMVQTHTVKASWLGLIAATLAGVPIRIYHVHGLLFSTSSGIKRKILQLSDAVMCRLSHRVFSVSRSIKDTILSYGFCPKGKITVIGPGSINGVDAENQFNPRKLTLKQE